MATVLDLVTVISHLNGIQGVQAPQLFAPAEEWLHDGGSPPGDAGPAAASLAAPPPETAAVRATRRPMAREPVAPRLRPQLVETIFETVKRLNEEEGVSFLLAEQNTNVALKYAKYGYILESGRVVLDGDAGRLRDNEDVKEFYLGLSSSGRRSFRDVKHYKRRKRWL